MAYEIIFIDSDIILDVVLVRELYFNESIEVLAIADNKKYICCTSVHSLLNIHYLTKKLFGEKTAGQSISMLIEKLRIITEDVNLVKLAIKSDFTDFEDAVQYYAASSIKADVIVKDHQYRF